MVSEYSYRDAITMTEPTLTDGELAEYMYMLSMQHTAVAPTILRNMALRLITALRASRSELAALSWATREYDEDTGYCLCGCCRHGI